MKYVAVNSFGGAWGLVLVLAPLNPALAWQSDLEARANLALNVTRSEIARVQVLGALGEPLFAVMEFHGQPVTLQLAPRSVRAPGFQLLEQRFDGSIVEIDPGPVSTYYGAILELPGSRVAANLLDGGLFARIFLAGGEELWLEPLAPRVVGALPEQHALYRREDVVCPSYVCGADLLPGNGPKPVGPSDPGPLTVKVAELAGDATHQFYQYWGGSIGGSNRIQSVIGAMNLQFETEVGITHEITTILIRTSSSQPYTSTDPFTLFDQFRNDWNKNQTWIPRDVAQLFSGPIPGSIAGIGAIGTVCRPDEAYSFVQGGAFPTFQCNTDLSAHELGHNWNATHCPCPDSTMNAGLSCTNTFSPIYSQPEIIAYRDSVGCLDTPGGGGLTSVLLSDGFENGDLASNGWSTQDSSASLAKPSAHTGAFGVRLRKSTWIERAVNTAGYPVIRLDYSRRTQAYDANELLYVEWWDGSAWQLVESTSSTAWADQSFLLGAAAGNNPAFRIRFRTNANMNNEQSDVDDVRVIGS